MGESKYTRPEKGQSLLCFPSDYTVVDIETTGLDPSFDEIIELSSLRVRGNAIADHFSTLIHPCQEINGFVSALTGITNDDVADAPSISEALPGFLAFVGNDTVVGHNVNFDINFIFDASASCGLPVFSNDFVDTMRISRRLLPDLKHHRLSDVSGALGIFPDSAHRGLFDCETTHDVLQALKSYADLQGLPLQVSSNLHASDIVAQAGTEQPDHPLYGKLCVFTGKLERLPRRDAMQLVVNIGGHCGDSVTAATNFLILGNNDYCAAIKDGKSSKQKKAESLILKGSDLQILSESVFYDLLGDLAPDSAGASPVRKAVAFGCCSRYEECSAAGSCTHPSASVASNCMYRKNLLEGRIFYGDNRNIK